MSHEILTPREMAEADRLAIAAGPFNGIQLMRNAGVAVATAVLQRYPAAAGVHVLCGPGNNGGDGYIVARLLAEAGVRVSIWAEGAPRSGSDAALAAAECPLEAQPISGFMPERGDIVVDALYGAGLSKPLSADAAAAIEKCGDARIPVVAVDLPSGISGETGHPVGHAAFRANVTVTFARKKPGHLLLPGREACGDILVADIGISDATVAAVGPKCFENDPALWRGSYPIPAADIHKYRRGHVGVFSGGPSATGAARLAAVAAARAGAGAVTVLSPGSALAINAAQLTSIILRRIDDADDARAFISDRKPSALVLGPGFGVGEPLRELALAILETAGAEASLVLDADGITSFHDAPASLFITTGAKGAAALVLTPHEGEFGRLFPDIARDAALSKLEKARKASARSHGVVIYKGPDTVIASPDGRAAINANGTPLLATAGSGDVLSGIVAALLAQCMPAFEAACAAVWMHAEAARRFGPGLIAEDLPLALLPVLRDLVAERSGGSGE
ncbi:NAD(P)H-hydrate dehydratase [Mesorhizobium sp. AaZ16]|uniref:NAD(P)H-hydrate dehydratase n=1 Tax=Mesorhizobium sp. AaZ16 TaxID=3402289 RepID=UPI00374FC579